VDWKLEVVTVPVSDVDRAKEFYRDKVGFALDVDHDGGGMRVVQLTPPGSACSIGIGSGVTDMEPGSVQGLQLVASDVDAVYPELARRGVGLSEIEELGRPGRPGFKFAYFTDPDGNGWVLQELKPPEQRSNV
jgi:catechol 2,3-dioxygenase-like lactoylglutathione lyase family enzyme